MSSKSMHPKTSPRARQAGFTLIELMVVVALVAILAMLATPSWTEMRIRNALRSSVNDFTSSLQFARSEAVRLNNPVTICPSSDGVNCTNTGYNLGWIVRTGPQANAAGQIILQDTLPNALFRLDATTAATRIFTFLPNGLPASNFAGATIQACPTDTHFAAMTRAITINRAGRITLSTPGSCSI
ncbi:GspH/FimT family pseudopilin [Hydrogenophaga sp. A37]